MIELSVDQRRLTALGTLLKGEANKQLLLKGLRAAISKAAAPGVSQVQAKLRAMPSRGDAKPAIGSYLATRVKVSTRLSGRSTGVRIRIGQTSNLRGFKFAARRFNHSHWRHKVFGRGEVVQISPIPEYFDATLFAQRSHYHTAVLAAVETYAASIGKRF